MQNNLFMIQNGKIIIDQATLTTYAIIAAVIVIAIVAIAVALKSRKKNFIKTIPTNLKDGE